MANNLKISITGTLNTGATIGEINTALKGIEKKINKIQLNVQISPQTQTALNSLTQQIRNLGSGSTNRATQNLSNQINNVGTSARNATQHTLTFGSALRQAVQGFSLWAMTAQMVYAPVRALQDMTARLIEIDTLMTDIRRVMDMPDFRFTQLLEEAVGTSDELSSKLKDVLSVMGEFGRMGFEDGQLVDITKTAQVLQNISDLDATSSVNTLTSAMLNFGIAADKSIEIADKLNEVDNNFAISTKDLSDGIRKAAASAKTFGVDINQLTGYIAAIGSTTRESGSIVGNGLKTIFARMTTMNSAIDALNSVGVSIKDMAGNVRPVSDIMEDLAGKWSGLTDEQRQNTAVSVAGKFQLTRFLALMNNFSMAQSATATAIDSSGSAMKEQVKYADSLEARINRLDTAWNKFTLAMGNAFLTDTLVGGIETLNSMATGVAKFVDKFGALGAMFGVIGVATVALSTKFKTFSTSLIFGTTQMTRMQLASAGLTAGMGRLGIATIGLKTAFRGLMAATVVGAIFVGIGFALEKLIGKYSEAKQAQEEFDLSQQKGIDALTSGKQATEQLIAQYNSLTEAKKNAGDNWSVKQEENYLAVQEKLADIYPALIGYIDGAGIKHLKSSEQIEKEIEATNRLIAAKKEEAKASAIDTFEKGIKKRDDLDEDVKSKQKTVESASNGGLKGSKMDAAIAKAKTEVVSLQNEWAQAQQKITSDVLKVADAYTKLQIDPSIKQGVDSFVSSLDLSKFNPEQLSVASKRIGETTDALQTAYETGNKVNFDNAKQSLIDYALEMGSTELQANNFAMSFDDLKKAAEMGAAAVFAGKEGMDGLDESAMDATDSVDGLTDATNSNTASQFKNMSAAEMIIGKKEEDINRTLEMIRVYQGLSQQGSLNEAQQYALATATDYLTSTYPHLINGKELNVKAMEKEAEGNNLLIKAIEAYANGQITAQELASVGTSVATKSRIEAMKAEMTGLQKLLAAYGELAEASLDTIMAQVNAGLLDEQIALPLIGIKAGIEQRQKEIDKLKGSLNGIKLPTINLDKPKGGGSSGGSGSKDDKPTAEEVRQAKIDSTIKKYEDQLNIQDQLLQQSQAIQERYKEGSKEWIAESNKQIAILEKKRSITTNEINDLNKLLKTEKLSKEQKAEVNAQIQELITSNLEYLNAIADVDHAIQESQINAKIEETEALYNKEIDALKKKLALMDEEEKKQDRINRKKELQDAIDKAKSDKRFEYIDANGNVQLTYDKAEVARLEKEKKDQEDEWKKEDERAALEKKIAEAEINRDKAIANLEKLQQTYLDKSYKDTAELKKIMIQFTKDLDTTFKSGTVKVPKHHDGGIVGQGSKSGSRLSSLVNDLFNVKPNEQIVKALKGEIMVPSNNIPNFLTNISNLAGQLLSNQPAQSVNQGTTIILQNPVIQANNPLELLQGLQSITRKK